MEWGKKTVQDVGSEIFKGKNVVKNNHDLHEIFNTSIIPAHEKLKLQDLSPTERKRC